MKDKTREVDEKLLLKVQRGLLKVIEEKDMQDKKYYTPTIEEFHVGFEYEAQEVEISGSSVFWQKKVFEVERLIKEIVEIYA